MDLKDRLKELRHEHDVSAVSLAEAVGKAKSTLSMWETGKANPDIPTLIAIADFFNVSVDYLIGRSDYKSYKDEHRNQEIGQLDFDENVDYDTQVEVLGAYKAFIKDANKYVRHSNADTLGAMPFLVSANAMLLAQRALGEEYTESLYTSYYSSLIKLLGDYLDGTRGMKHLRDSNGAIVSSVARKKSNE